MPQRDVRTRIDERLKTLRDRLVKEGAGDKARARRSCKKALEACRNHPAVRRACEIAGIDYNEPSVLAALLIDLASARFSKEKGGREKKWDSVRLTLLFNSYLRLQKKYPKLKDRQIFSQMVKETDLFREEMPETLRRKFVDAVDGNKNLLLKHALFGWEDTAGVPPRRRRRGLPDWKTLPDRADEGGYVRRLKK